MLTNEIHLRYNKTKRNNKKNIYIHTRKKIYKKKSKKIILYELCFMTTWFWISGPKQGTGLMTRRMEVPGVIDRSSLVELPCWRSAPRVQSLDNFVQLK